ncbi:MULTISPECIES: hypothetical protein [Tenuifilum]|uniref:Uncharacterized protein n=1 Tax=Tenuifilum thalassicum TaxID=2590900 RepID=A0A7D3XER3_9BACT|nr:MULTISPECIES: hypothetical protein [Tenuifilum]QKG80492.1 hypothetical protein FHG85_09510 [Tenuifilum thalassicum]
MRSSVYILILAISTFLAHPFSANAQCKNFAKKICKLELAPYVHDGNYNAAILTEGEEAELFKTFYAGQEYRISVCGSDALSKIEFIVMDVDRNVLYTNAKDDFATSWDFKVENTQQLIIMVKVPVASDSNEELKSGCVAIMFGLKTD